MRRMLGLPYGAAETGVLYDHRVVANREERDRVKTGVIGAGGEFHAGSGAGGDHLRAGDHCALRVGDYTADTGLRSLRGSDGGHQE